MTLKEFVKLLPPEALADAATIRLRANGLCGEEINDQWRCTRRKGHAGYHISHGYSVNAVWSPYDDEYYST